MNPFTNRCGNLIVALTIIVLGSAGYSAETTMQTAVPTTAPSTIITRPPNVVLILVDDIGYGNTSTFGGLAQTPVLDQFAAHGARFTNLNNNAMCSPTRASLLTGLNDHRVGFGALADLPGAAPGYDSVWKPSAICIADVLHHNGYSTAMIGKWHNTPWKEITPVGPFNHWPTSLGFDYYYGFMEPGASSEWEPHSLYRGTTPVEPYTTPDKGYHLTTDLTNEAIRWIQTHETLAPQKPYFLYFATGAVHFPHHAPKEWIDKYHGQFDMGWDKLREQVIVRQKALGVIPANTDLTARPPGIRAWDSLSDIQKKVYAHEMEVYCGFISHTDHEIGRLLDVVQQSPQGNNTLVIYIVGDNGGSPGSGEMGDLQFQLNHLDEFGGPKHSNGIEDAWAWASSTPFQWFKSYASHFGGVRNPMIVSWPGHIKELAKVRGQFAHVNDIAPTIYDALGIKYPETLNGIKTQPLDGTSLTYTFAHPEAPSAHHKQYFLMFGHRAIYEDGWIACARHTNGDFLKDTWELYHVAEDYSEAHNVADQFPDKLKQLHALFIEEAKANGAFPLDGAGPWYQTPFVTGDFIFHVGDQRLLGVAAPRFLKAHRVTVDLDIPPGGAQGVLVTLGSRWGGFVVYVKDGHVIYDNNVGGEKHEVITSSAVLPTGKVVVGYEFVKDENWKPKGRLAASGVGHLTINGQEVGQATIHYDGEAAFWGSFGVGQGFAAPICDAYSVPFKFTGSLERVKVELTPAARKSD